MRPSADGAQPTVHESIIILIGVLAVLGVVGLSLIGGRNAGSLFGNCLVFGLAACLIVFGVFWFLSGDALRSYFN